MYIHTLRKSTTGMGGSVTRRCKTAGSGVALAKSNHRNIGAGVHPSMFENQGGGVRGSEILRNLRVTKPRIPKKFISFDA